MFECSVCGGELEVEDGREIFDANPVVVAPCQGCINNAVDALKTKLIEAIEGVKDE